jgi:hypothetical protein
MKISVRSSEPHADVWVYLTEGETEELANALRSRLEGEAGYQGVTTSTLRTARGRS